ncbi:hypothetical protein [Phenylobacterium sp.]|uniref:hypothetical protein n=1 Tax=Phenylobacterium sp. TaxID=1871053 RepID=UPI0025DD0A4F|nr:hypothetical protein [Phenylobacterium sp.]MBX3485546.1 hypothetical protein [Phenylobacterium sp.]MCW5761023.1 hypothetical protein [Phenylobacterium sp.]
MSEALPDIGDIDAVLGLVLRVDLALLQHVNAQALETTDPDTLNDYVRSQARLTRSVRTTLTTRARLLREEAPEPRRAHAPGREDLGPDLTEQLEMEDAVHARVCLEYDPVEAEEIDPELGELVEWVRKDAANAGLSREARVDAVMALVHTRLGPPKAAPEPAPPAEPPPQREPPPDPDPFNGRLAPPMHVPSWECDDDTS